MSAIRFQVMPPLAPDEYQELRDDIADRGVIEPIHVDEHGVVIDGHHRKRIADDLGIECPTIVHDDLDDAGKRSLAFTLNLKRRHLNREQRRALIAESLRADPELSNREHERRTGTHKNTVQAVREELEGSGQIAHFEKRQDPRTGNLSQPASQPPRPEPESESESEGEEDTPAPSWEPAGHIHPADLAALNRPDPTPKPEPAPRPAAEKRTQASEHTEYRNPAEHVTKLMQHMRTATKALKEAIFTAQHIDNWSGGDITSDLRTQLDELDNTLDSGGFDMELARLLKEQDDE